MPSWLCEEKLYACKVKVVPQGLVKFSPREIGIYNVTVIIERKTACVTDSNRNYPQKSMISKNISPLSHLVTKYDTHCFSPPGGTNGNHGSLVVNLDDGYIRIARCDIS